MSQVLCDICILNNGVLLAYVSSRAYNSSCFIDGEADTEMINWSVRCHHQYVLGEGGGHMGVWFFLSFCIVLMYGAVR